jgi:hypothetical protein
MEVFVKDHLISGPYRSKSLTSAPPYLVSASSICVIAALNYHVMKGGYYDHQPMDLRSFGFFMVTPDSSADCLCLDER